MAKNKKVMIVIEENGKQGGKGFNVYLDGDIDNLNTTKDDDLSPAEFWGKKLFQICAHTINKTVRAFFC